MESRRNTVVFINGPPRSGKDTVAGIIETYLPWGRVAVQMKFAAPIKCAVAAAFAMDEDSAYKYLETKEKDITSDKAFGNTFRDIMIGCSEAWLKPLCGRDVFGKLAWAHMDKLLSQGSYHTPYVFIFSDCGFQEEYDVILEHVDKKACILISLHREGCTFAGDSRSYIKPQGVLNIHLDNNGTLSHLSDKVGRLVEESLLAAGKEGE